MKTKLYPNWLRFTAMLTLLLAALAPAGIAHAATCTVTSALDDGSAATLRVLLADTSCDTINFAGDTTIYLTSPLTIARSVTIDGGTSTVVISGDTDGDGAGEVMVFVVMPGVTAALQNLVITNGYSNIGGGGIWNRGTLTVSGSTFSGNHAAFGGGIYSFGGTATVADSTFSGNSAGSSGGAIFWGDGALTVTNSTFSGNRAAHNGGGIVNYYRSARLTVSGSTFSGNSAVAFGGGIANASGTVTLRDTIVANSTSGGNCYNESGTLGGSNNLADDDSCGSSFTNSSNILLGTLGSYGGSTQTIPLLPGSAAIDAGDSSACGAADQRGLSRVGTCDIGAFESQGFTLTASGGDDQLALAGANFANPLEVIVSSKAGPAEPVDGGVVTFTAPGTEPSATLSAGSAAISSGKASVTATASNTIGGYSVVASAAGADPASFTLTNGSAPAITGQPASVTVNAGQSATFSAAADGVPAPTVQWQVSTDGGSTWADLSGATGASYSVTTASSMNGYQYQAVFTNPLGSATTNPATLTVVNITGISGKVFNDINGSGTQDKGEGNLSGWTVQLQDPATGAIIMTATTDANGNYQFTQLQAASYRVRLVLQGSYLQTTPNPADTTLVDGQAVTGVHFGAAIPADLKVSMTGSYNAKTQIIVYTITVTNNGPTSALLTVAKDLLPNTVSYSSVKPSQGNCSVTGKTVTCNLGKLASGSSATITLKVTRTSTKTAVVNTVTVSSNICDNDLADNSVTVTIK